MARKIWVICDDDIEVVREALMASTHEANCYNCEDWPPGSGCAGCRGDKMREEAIHTLDVGLQTPLKVIRDALCEFIPDVANQVSDNDILHWLERRG